MWQLLHKVPYAGIEVDQHRSKPPSDLAEITPQSHLDDGGTVERCLGRFVAEVGRIGPCPCHHKPELYLDAYIEAAGLRRTARDRSSAPRSARLKSYQTGRYVAKRATSVQVTQNPNFGPSEAGKSEASGSQAGSGNSWGSTSSCGVAIAGGCLLLSGVPFRSQKRWSYFVSG
jgi:hypothetical protein